MSATLERLVATGGAHAAAAAALARLRAAGIPGRKHEDWRYTNLAILDDMPGFDAVAPTQPVALPGPLPGYQRLLVLDGRLQGALPAGLRLCAAAPTADDPRGLLRFARLAEGRAPGVIALEATGELALELVIATHADVAASYSAIELQLAPGACVRLAERHVGSTGARGLACSSLRLSLGDGASLTHERLLALDGKGLHLDTLEATLGHGATHAQRCMAAGPGTLRTSQRVALAGREARLDWQGVAVAGAGEVRDLVLALAHEGPGTESRQLFRGIADARGRVACTADAHVAASAAGTRLSQSLRGLLDGEGAEVDLKPRLVILTDAVQASHGATTGRLDDDLLFYLLARGLDAAEARALLKWAFLGEVFSACQPAPLRLAAEQAIAARLRERPPAELLQ